MKLDQERKFNSGRFCTKGTNLGDVGCLVNREDQILAICNGLDGDYDSVVGVIQEGGITVQELGHKLLAQEGWLER